MPKKQWLHLTDFNFLSYNPNVMAPDSFDYLMESIKGFTYAFKGWDATKGWRLPVKIIVNDYNSNILDGNHRVKGLTSMGQERVHTNDVTHLWIEDEQKERAFVLAIRNIQGDFDDYKLKEILLEMDEDLRELAGFDDDDLADIVERLIQEEEPTKGMIDDDEVPEVKKATCKMGDLWILGEHKLLCGDATKAEDVERLMNGEKADMVFTSPPYNLGISSKLSGNSQIAKQGNVYNNYDDKKTESDWKQLIESSLDIIMDHSKYQFINLQLLAGNKKALIEFQHDYVNNIVDVMVWDKEHAPPAAAEHVLNSRFEYIFILTKEQNPKRCIKLNKFRGTIDNVYVGPPQRNNKSSSIHGATFPAHLPEYFVSSFATPSSVVLDPFGGSGTTLIACEKLNRKCRMMEIDPHYCDVIIKRFEEFSGKKAEVIT